MLGSLIYFLRRKKSGRIELAPGEGTVVVQLDFRPEEVVVYFPGDRDDNDCDEDDDSEEGFEDCDHHSPSCVELVDEITNLRILLRGLKFDYNIQSGIRTVKWKARR